MSKVWLITGAGSGIGAGIARAAQRAGDRVVATGRNLDKVRDALRDVAGVVGFKHCAAYAASKFAVEGVSLSVAAEVERFGIKITLVEPGFFRTDLLDDRNVKWPSKTIGDYADEASPQQTW